MTLMNIIQDVIRKEGPITIERYMELVLHHPDHGYYRHGNPLDAEGDFLTSPEASPVFGEMAGAWIVEAWKRCGMPAAFVLLELGPGQGTLLRTALAFVEHNRDFMRALRLLLLESNKTLRQVQEQGLSNYCPTYIQNIDELPPLPTIVLANEFFDTLPMRQFVRSMLGWRECRVGCQNGALHFTHQFTWRLPPYAPKRPLARKIKVGSTYEYSAVAADYMDRLATHIAAHTGAALIIDYGYITPPDGGTLDALHQHKFVDVLSSPGEVDVTAGVDFSVLAHIASQKGNVVADIVTQRDFLERMGVLARAEMLREQLAPEQRQWLHHGLRYIASMSHMGKFKVLEFGSYGWVSSIKST